MAHHMAVAPGTKLGPYEIQSQLGAGGMGEVYRAKDLRLDRSVAIKVLPGHLSSNPELKERFVREARAISSLNHPRICTLHDVGQQEGVDFLVMEFLEGESLAQRLQKGALPIKEVLKIGVEVSEALEVAHRAGIVHRDLKPGNIMLTKTGAKLMDFGLAKAVESTMAAGTSSAPLLSGAPTMSGLSPLSPLTMAGAVVGTVQYMAPEQVEGKLADARSDIFALGATLYEAATGKRAFDGKSQIAVANSILEKDPEPASTLNPQVPRGVDHVIARCLAKDPEQRWQTARDLGLELGWSAQASPSSTQITPVKRRSQSLPWIVSGALALLLLVALFSWLNRSSPATQAQYFAAPFTFTARDLTIAPNGHTVAVVGYRSEAHKNGIFLYELGSQNVRLVPDTDGASFPFWSADGLSLGFFADGKLRRVDIAGGPAQTLCDAPGGRGGTWNKDGVIVFTPSGALRTGLWRISAAGGKPEQLTTPDASKGEDGHRWPVFLPDGQHYIYTIFNNTVHTEFAGLAVGALGSKEQHFLLHAISNGSYAAPGYLLYYRDNTLFAQRFNATKLQLEGEPAALLSDLQYMPRIQRATFSSTGTGAVLAQLRTGNAVSQLTWFDRSGKSLGDVADPDYFGALSLSPNGQSLAVDKVDSGSQNTDVWLLDLHGGAPRRITFDPSIDALPVWSPAASEIAFVTNRELHFSVYRKSVDGHATESVLINDLPDNYPNDWSRDGKYFLYVHGTGLWYLTFSDMTKKEFLNAGTSALKTGHFSPDGKWIAYASNESGKWEIYVTSFPDAKGKWEISSGGGEQPHWRGDGKELYYLSSSAKMMAVPVTTGANFSAGTPAALFQADPRELVATTEQVGYDVSSDGQKFLINSAIRNGESQQVTVILNWNEKLNK
ncbi:serine/threonine protein kinase [Candidatus Koribacter versatilis Ellin345]|uniref:non-specific serine/threonine protein kinase n=1 Tax=Koribacter versatilis (strain Ellin345) TaxID=204669 RepID=Q1IV32_KORVE|nr:protein kinase [Candidatus Koribacter versatilis]ABF39268.1 serine/threonine protein kinase [Candidatus Koribacter versatilis Ellin345]